VDEGITDGRFQYVDCLAKMGRWRESRDAALDGLRYVGKSQSRGLRRQVASADSALGRRYWRRSPTPLPGRKVRGEFAESPHGPSNQSPGR
jgi:hypothetical protein